MRRKKKTILILTPFILIILLAVLYLLYYFGIIPHKCYSNADFGINPYTSAVDRDGDGIDDQTDILQNARTYVETNPHYQSKYYGTGYPDDEYGVCTDVVAFALLNSGYDLMELVNQDIRQNRDDYQIETIDKKIDFRRVRNLKVYFKHTAVALTTDINEIDEWQGGDIVVFEDHIGIVSDKRNCKGIPFVIHLAPYQIRYEEDFLKRDSGKIAGHYRIS